jgi:tripartite-type tricarboxylate transporter receptor subunit TctC
MRTTPGIESFVRSIGLLAVIFAVAFSFMVSESRCQEKFPSKPVKIIITHGAGGNNDIPTRGMAQHLQKYLGVPVVCENMEGAGGRRAMEYVFNQAKPDGYTMVASVFPSTVILELLYEPKFKMKEFVHVGGYVGGDSRCSFVGEESPFKSFKDLVEEGKKRRLTVAGGGGYGSTSQLQYVYLKEIVKLDVELIPFDSGAEVTSSVLGKHTDFGTQMLSGAIRMHRDGTIRILATHGTKRMPEIPEVPTMKELGYSGCELTTGVGVWAPPGTPKDRAKILSDGVAKASRDPEFVKWAGKSFILLDPLGPEEFYNRTLEDYKNISRVVPIVKKLSSK